MSNSKIVSFDEIESATKKLEAEGISPASATRGQISRAMNVTDRRARTIQEKLRRNTTPAVGEYTQNISGDSWQISLPKTTVGTVEELLDKFDVDQDVWEVERFVVNAWGMGAKDAVGELQTTQLYQVKAWLKRKAQSKIAIVSEINALKEEAKQAARVYTKIDRPLLTNNMLEINIPDLHIGKLGWTPETGGDHYDVKIAQRMFEEALDVLLARTSAIQYEKILFVVGNDLLHTDTKQGTTQSGTPMDTDGRYHKSFLKARKMMTNAIERCRLIAPVDVLVVPGNHDGLSSWHLGDSLECTFAKCDDVVIDNTPNFRKYYQFGKVMLMFAHGNKGKLTDYPLVMATEQPEMFGSTRFREAHTGDKHQTKTQELHGVRVRILPALCGTDAWHSEHMFVGNQRCAEAFIWNKEEGLIGTALYTV